MGDRTPRPGLAQLIVSGKALCFQCARGLRDEHCDPGIRL
jgi:hypothetical protein